jgi:hypothetical protein
MGRKRDAYRFLVGKPSGDDLEDLGIDVRILL